MLLRKKNSAGHQWLMPIILATQEAEFKPLYQKGRKEGEWRGEGEEGKGRKGRRKGKTSNRKNVSWENKGK
jgi:predicted transposase YdaD